MHKTKLVRLSALIMAAVIAASPAAARQKSLRPNRGRQQKERGVKAGTRHPARVREPAMRKRPQNLLRNRKRGRLDLPRKPLRETHRSRRS